VNSLFLPSCEEMRHCDEIALSNEAQLGAVMERAGYAVAQEILFRSPGNIHYLVFIGSGNNGGDGLVVARWLKSWGKIVRLCRVDSANFSELWILNAKRFQDCGGEIEDLPTFQTRGYEEILPVIKVDAILGNGQSGALKPSAKQLVEFANGIPGKWIALDIPTGLNGSTGEVDPSCVNAAITISIQAHKRGLLQYPARGIAGSLVAVDVGIPIDSATCKFQMLSGRACRRILKRRSTTAHKGTLGTTMIIGGSSSMKGAPILAALAALRVGAGKVIIASSREVLLAVAPPELMTRCIAEGRDISEVPTSPSFILDGITSLVIGPGLGRSSAVQALIVQIVNTALARKIPTVIDADGLYPWRSIMPDFSFSNAVITPHPGEARALLGEAANLLETDRYSAATALRKKFSEATVVLKGPGTIIEAASGGHVDGIGNAALAAPGSGDVLAGLIGGLISQGYTCEEGALLGVGIHSALASENCISGSVVPLTAIDLIAKIPATMQKLLER